MSYDYCQRLFFFGKPLFPVTQTIFSVIIHLKMCACFSKSFNQTVGNTMLENKARIPVNIIQYKFKRHKSKEFWCNLCAWGKCFYSISVRKIQCTSQ